MDDGVESRLINLEIGMKNLISDGLERKYILAQQIDSLNTVKKDQQEILEVVANIQAIVKTGSFLVSVLRSASAIVVSVAVIYTCIHAIRQGDWKAIFDIAK